MKPKKAGKLPKGKMIPDSKPENGYKKAAKGAIKSRAMGKKSRPC